MGSNINAGINSLFQSLSSSGGAGNQNFLADYASIKNGSYRKLMKAYYSTGQNSSTTGKSTSSSNNVIDKLIEERKNPKVSKQVQEANANLTTGLSSLKNSVSALQNDKTFTNTENGQSAADKVSSAMKSFVSDYNAVVTAAKGSTLTGKTAYVSNMMHNTAANADKLSEMGITINRNGTLLLDENKLKTADLSKVQELFSSKDSMSYGSKIMSRLQFANTTTNVNNTNTSSTTDSTETNNTAGSSAASLKADGELLASDKLYEKVKDKDGNETDSYDIDKIFAAAKSFVSNYNNMFDTAESSANSGVLANLSRIKEKTSYNTSVLKQFGISVDQKGRMKIDEDTFKKSDMSKVQKFFKDYGSSISTSASLVDYYMTTQANAANSYTSAGAYNVQGSARYADSI